MAGPATSAMVAAATPTGLTFDDHGNAAGFEAAMTACEESVGPAPSIAPVSAPEASALYDACLEPVGA